MNIVRDWLKALAPLVASNLQHDELRAKITAYVPLLEEEFTPAAFTRASLAEVALQCTFFPAYAELCEKLRAWAEKQPKSLQQLAIAGPSNGLDELDNYWLAYWQTRLAENFGPARKGALPSTREHVAGLVRQQSPRAWAAIAGIDP